MSDNSPKYVPRQNTYNLTFGGNCLRTGLIRTIRVSSSTLAGAERAAAQKILNPRLLP